MDAKKTTSSKKSSTKKTTKKKTGVVDYTKSTLYTEQQLMVSSLSSLGEEGKESALYANNYFKNIKENASEIDMQNLIAELNYLPNQIEDLKSIGQTGLAKKLSDRLVHITYERVLLQNGFNQYIHRKDIVKYIDLVKDKVVKCCELELFPRIIPDAPKALLKKARSLNVFKDFWVVFTDYTENEVTTEEQKEIRKKNRDPIIFGTFEGKDDADLTNMYFICDWEDEFCDITLDKMVKTLTKSDKNYSVQEIVPDIESYVNNIVREYELNQVKKTRFSDKVKKFFGLK